MLRRPSAYGWVAIGFLGLIARHPACALQATPGQSGEQAATGPVTTPEGEPALVPLGDPAGGYGNLPVDLPNPLEGQAGAADQGRQLYIQMNCAGCHGYTAGGGMGPNLTGKYWRYGGTPVQIFKSIYEGRPQGMPSWGNILQPEGIWMIVSFIQLLGGGFPASFYDQAQEGDHPGDLVAPELATGKNPPARQGSTTARERPKQ